ncbi:uncharacterized protein KY384_000061 [Bacidia gigantensis]|uniref:uncharacterized protein n=1 Tax=Bacidia gigantensis TaxID=2732470 RepID=UPI001D04D2DB|nr:uncharacterized protein KY384_000061 [Bacidia gigantensis]KAG8526405.1 hypothetical protein KY384_000061 [Bacidia gigantensis]
MDVNYINSTMIPLRKSLSRFNSTIITRIKSTTITQINSTSIIQINSTKITQSYHDAVSSKEPQYTESQILNFVLGLEHFQDAFYREGLKNFTQAQFANYGFDASFYSNLTEIASQEHTHVTYVTTELRRLKASPVAECKYNFNVTNPSVFVTTASLIESVSVSAYIDVLSQLRGSAFLKVFSSVLAVEARHSSFIRAALGNQPFASPYDTPIDLDEAHTLVELFTVSCPEDNPLGLKVSHHALLDTW